MDPGGYSNVRAYFVGKYGSSYLDFVHYSCTCLFRHGIKSLPTDGSGKMLPAGAVMREAIGPSENGLRVEVSLKYRRLLVQKLAKESLLSAKDHENFRSAQFARVLCTVICCVYRCL